MLNKTHKQGLSVCMRTYIPNSKVLNILSVKKHIQLDAANSPKLSATESVNFITTYFMCY